MIDPDAGTSTYHYNAYGELESQTDANGYRISMHYDQLGRITDRYIEPLGEYIRYTFDTKPNGIGLLSSVAGPQTYQQEFSYDELSRLTRKDENIDGMTYSYYTTYDIFGRVKKEIYPSGYSTINRYNPLGYLSSIARGDTERDIWKLENMNPRGQIKRFTLGNGLTTTQDYDDYGFLTGITTDPGIQSLAYNFDHATGNLSYRSDNKYNLTEEFDYDEILLNSRLTQCKINGALSLSTSYQNNGNIDTKSDVGTYAYTAIKPHVLKTVDFPEPDFVDNSPLQQITYTAVGKVRTITQDNPGSPGNPYLLNLYYGPDNQRIKSELFYGLTRIKTKIFGQSGYESIVDQAGNKIQLHYLTSPSGVFAVYVKANGVESIYYLHTDHLGSLYAITGDDGRIVTRNGEEAVYSFDAWGRRRNPVNWTYEGFSSDFLIDRGFTFHEHLDEFGLINMNGRVYDPVIGRFLSPDNYVQGGFTQSLNRYSYCQNNPLIATDPSGEIFIGFITTLVGEFFKTGLTKGGFELWNWNKTYFQEAWADFDPGVEGNVTNNAWKIDMGQLKVDENRTFAGQAFQIIARFSGELEQTMYGNMYSHLRNVSGNVDDVSYYRGATLVNKNEDPDENGFITRWGLTLGSYINSQNLVADPSESKIFRHEYGHTLQSRLTGPLYVGHVGMPSLVGQGLEELNLNNHSYEWYETLANRMSYRYLDNHVPDALNDLAWPSDDPEYPRDYKLTWYWIIANPPIPFAWWLFF